MTIQFVFIFILIVFFWNLLISCVFVLICLWSYQYAQQNVPKSSNALRTKHIKHTRSTTHKHDNCQNKQEYCIWKTVYITNHSKNENHVSNAWNSRWLSQFFLKVFHNIITANHSLLVLFITFTLSKIAVCEFPVCRIFFFL